MKYLIFYFLIVFCAKSFALSADECRELIGDINTPSGQEEWGKCLYSSNYVKPNIQNNVTKEDQRDHKTDNEESINKVFGFWLGLNAISELKKLSKTENVKIRYSACLESRCEIGDYDIEHSAEFVFDRNVISLSAKRGKPTSESFKKKNEIDDYYTKPTLSEIGTKVVKVEIGTRPKDSYYLYFHNGLLIGIRPVKEFMDSLPFEKKEMISILDKKYPKLKTLHEKTTKEKFLIYKSSILRWEMNENIEIRLFSDESESINYSRCIVEKSTLNKIFNTNVCLPTNKNILLYVLKQPFDTLERDISIRRSKIANTLWEEHEKNKIKF